jgi:hypothetical protein
MMTLDAAGLIKKHKARGVFVDTNLLVLLLTGLVNPNRIGTFKRTGDFELADFHLLQDLVNWFGAPLYSTPHVLSQVSDLTDMGGRDGKLVRKLLKGLISTVDEKYDSAQQLADTTFFERLGLADASIATVCNHDILALTADFDLYITLASRGLDALNFNHVRAMQWRI